MFSIIITCYNEGLELRRAVESVRRQTYTDYEIIVVKDFSDHAKTLQVCRELEQEGIQVLYAEKNVGVSITRNMGIAEAKGDYIYTVDGDDELPVDALEHITRTFEENPNADVVFGNYELIEGEDNRVVDCSILVGGNNMLRIDKFFKSRILPIGQNATLREVAIQYPLAIAYSFGCQDYELQVRMLKSGVKFVHSPHVLYRWYKKPTGINSSKRNADSLDMCMYEHLDFVAPYLGCRYLLQLCKQNNDAESYRKYFVQHAPRWCKWARILPFRLMIKFGRFVK